MATDDKAELSSLSAQTKRMPLRYDDIVIHPIKTRRDREIPGFGILFVNPGEANAALAEVLENGGRRNFLHNSNLAVNADNSLFIAGPAIGAPAAVLVMEKLIALGAQRIILMGWCGAVDRGYGIGDIVIPGQAVSGEGTSQYYCDGGQRPPSLQTIEFLQGMMSAQKLEWKGGTIWSTDAPYRESRKYLAELHGTQKVIGVDMEFSALCNVAGFRGIDFAAILLISDEIMGEAWTPGFKKTVFTERSKLLIKLLIRAHYQGIS